MTDVDTEHLASVVGPKWASHYRKVFTGKDGSFRPPPFLASWNWAAACVPFWHVYRRIGIWTGAFALVYVVLAYLGFRLADDLVFGGGPTGLDWQVVISSLVLLCVAQGSTGNRLVWRWATRTIATETTKSEGGLLTRLARRAPAAPPRGHVRHGVISLMLAPVWFTAVGGTLVMVKPIRHVRGSVYVAEMRSALRNLETAQELFYSDSGRYATSLTEQEFDPGRRVTIELELLSDTSWRATATHSLIPNTCTLIVGGITDSGGEPECS